MRPTRPRRAPQQKGRGRPGPVGDDDDRRPAPSPATLHKGIGLCLLAIFLFQVVNLLGKHLAEAYPIPLLVFFRSLFALLASTLLIARTGRPALLRTRRPAVLVLRALVWLAMLFCSFASYHLLPVPAAATIGFSAPVLAALLASLVLKERLPPGGWCAVGLAFLGVTVALRPGGALLPAGILAALGNAAFYALGAVMARALARSEASATIVFYCCAVATAASAIVLPVFWIAPAPGDLFLLCVLGLLGALAQYLATDAYRLAPASLVAPFTYSGVVWALLFGALIWDERPDGLALLGAAMIVAAGFWLFRLSAAAAPAPVSASNVAGRPR